LCQHLGDGDCWVDAETMQAALRYMWQFLYRNYGASVFIV
jgi:hypothetical protein